MGYLVWSMDDLASAIKRMQDEKFDCIIVFDGKRGLGKSTGAVKLALRLGGFKMKRDIAFARDDVMRQLAKKKKGIILADEMINVTYNRDFFAEDQKKILKMLNMYRDSGNILLACVPSFYALDTQFRQLVKIRINVTRRGMAVIHTQNQGAYQSDPWDLKRNEKIEQGWVKRKIYSPRYARLTTFRGILRYGDLGVKQRREYEKIKEEKRNIIVQNQEEEAAIKDGQLIPVPYARLVEMLKDGRLDKDKLLQISSSAGWQIDTVKGGINRYLKNRGENTSFAKLVESRQKSLEKLPLITNDISKNKISSKII